MTTAYLNRIATAVPEHDVHDSFVVFAEKMLTDPRLRTVFRRMASRADIKDRYSFLDPTGSGQFSSRDANEFYRLGNFPNTTQRMEVFEQSAPVLMRKVMDRLALSEEERFRITHVLVTCCTGLYAPGLDFEIVEHLRLSPGVERTMIGFMGCYAAIATVSFAPKAYTGTIAASGVSIIQVSGIFTLLGIAHDLTIPLQIHFDGPNTTAKGEFSVPYVQWGLKNPSFLIWKAEDHVEVELNLIGNVRN